MSYRNSKLISYLFETNAIRVCPENQPFWYTSGTIGPYYINTHFLYGSEKKANSLLKIIDETKNNILECPVRVLEAVRHNYSEDPVFKSVMDDMSAFIKENINIDQVDFISGGERRDWFFSMMAAELLGLPHITIYKDMKMVMSINGKTVVMDELKGMKILHIADLLNEASSYEKAWIPAIRSAGGEICWSVVVVDRKQGGEEFLMSRGIQSMSMVSVDRTLFEKARQMGLIDESQFKMVADYMENPRESMKKFLLKNPDFLKNSLNSDAKTAERAKLCIEKDIYGLNG